MMGSCNQNNLNNKINNKNEIDGRLFIRFTKQEFFCLAKIHHSWLWEQHPHQVQEKLEYQHLDLFKNTRMM